MSLVYIVSSSCHFQMYRLHEPQLQIRPIDWSAGTSYRPKPSSDGSNELFKRGMISKPSIEMGQCQSSLASQIYNRVSTLKNSLIIQCSAQFSGNKTIRFYIPVFCIGLPRMEMLSYSSYHPNVLNHLLLRIVIINVTSSISFC